MRGILNIAIALLCVYQVGNYFLNPLSQYYIFGFAVPSIAYLLFWVFCLFSSAMAIYRTYKRPK